MRLPAAAAARRRAPHHRLGSPSAPLLLLLLLVLTPAVEAVMEMPSGAVRFRLDRLNGANALPEPVLPLSPAERTAHQQQQPYRPHHRELLARSRSIFLKHETLNVRDAHIDAARSIHVKLQARTFSSQMGSAEADRSEANQFLVHVKMPVLETTIEQINAAARPYKLGEYVPHNTFVLFAPETVAYSLLALPHVLFVAPLDPIHKIHPRIVHHHTKHPLVVERTKAPTTATTKSLSTSDQPQRPLRVVLIKTHDDEPRTLSSAQKVADDIRERIAHVSKQIGKPLPPFFVCLFGLSADASAATPAGSTKFRIVSAFMIEVRADEAHLDEIVPILAENPHVHWVEPKPVAKLLNQFARKSVQVAAPSPPSSSSLLLLGF